MVWDTGSEGVHDSAGFNGRGLSWGDINRLLSDQADNAPGSGPDGPRRKDGRARRSEPGRDGGDSPAWSAKRLPYEPPRVPAAPTRTATPYAELHCHSSFSFLDGASHPEALVEEAVRLGLEALAITDHDGFYGVVRFAEAARSLGIPTVFGAELTLGLERPPLPVSPPRSSSLGSARSRLAGLRNGVADPAGGHLLVLARSPDGYARLARTISEAHLRGMEKGRPVLSLEEAAAEAGDAWTILTGCRKGPVPAALLRDGPAAAHRELDRVVALFGRDNVAVELWDHGDPLDSARNDAMALLAAEHDLAVVATNDVHYATPASRPLATALAAVRARRSLDEIDGWLPAGAMACLRSGDEQERRFARWPGAVEAAARIGRESAFDLRLVAPNLPPFPVPTGHTEMSFLRQITEEGGRRRYGPRDAETVPGSWAQIDKELGVIEQLGFPGYFLVVWDIVEFCRKADIFCQGRGSAANSAVCFALGVTRADAVKLGLLFERFLSPERDGPPDIDIDIESGRREEAIQYVYERHGRRHAAQVANVITYRGKSAVRDAGKALGHPQGAVDAWSKRVDGWSRLDRNGPIDVPQPVLDLAAQFEDLPRHLGIHSGGMVMCDRPVIEVCPVEWGRMANRTVLQWDKDDCAAAGLVKFDLLGLGMLTMLHLATDLVKEATGTDIDLAGLDGKDDAVYDMVCAADTIGVFQIESRAQMATLPRLQPRTFYDLVVEVALIRPGPIQGGSVHPYIRRRNGLEPVTYLHPLLEKSLAKTLGVPLFQEQLMQMAIDVAGFTGAEADTLRQAMGSKRSTQRMQRLRGRFFEGTDRNEIERPIAEQIFDKLAAFANFGFPESHSVSFAYLVYSSSWLKLYHPAAFCAALLNAQPMGFWSPQTICADARRHGITIRPVDLAASGSGCTLEPDEGSTGGFAVRLGLAEVRALSDDVADRIVAERTANGAYETMEDLARRAQVGLPALEALATAGAFRASLGLGRREALWAAGAVAEAAAGGRLPGLVIGTDAPMLPGMDEVEEVAADLWATGVGRSPLELHRSWLAEAGAVTSQDLTDVERLPHGTRVLVAGIVTHRQRPATAGGTTFLNLEDETGLVNVICSKGCWAAHRRIATGAPALVIRGRLERVAGFNHGVVNVIAGRIDRLDLSLAVPKSRDFR